MKKTTCVFVLLFSIFVFGTPGFASTVWLDEVILFDQPPGSSNDGGPPTDALGEPDAAQNWTGFVSIDVPETLIVAFTDNRAIDGSGNDIKIDEYYNRDSSVDVYASMDNLNYVYLGQPNGDIEYDIADYPDLKYINYLKFIGLDDGGGSAGFDLDAVEALNSVPLPISPINHDFGIVTIDCTPTQAFTVTNEQDENLQLGTFSITGLDSAEFLIQNDTCSGQTLAPDGTCTFDVLFDPDSLGSKNAVLSIPFNEPGIDALKGRLSGLVTEVCEGDFDIDGDVDGSDLAVFAEDFGRTDCGTGEPCEGDFDDDNDVYGSDLAVFAADFGRTDCPDCPTSD